MTTAGILGFAALRTASDLSRDRNSLGVSRERLDDTRNRTATLALATDVVTAAAIACSGVGLYLSLTARTHADAAPQHSMVAAPAIGIHLQVGTVGLSGAFE